MANEYTLADYEQMAPDDLSKAVIRTWREKSAWMEMVSFKSDPALSQRFMRFNSVPLTHWRKVSETFSDVKVNPDFVGERLFFFGDKIDTPYEYVKAPSIQDPRKTYEQAILEGQVYMFNTAFWINTPTDDEDAIVGLHYRVINDFASGQSVNGAGLDISPDTATTNISHKFFDLLGDLLDRVEGEDSQKILCMNRTVYMRAQSLMRQSLLLNSGQDQLGRKFMTYGANGPRLVQIGYKYDQSTQIMPDTELADGTAITGGATSSIFCLRFGEPYIAGWMQEAPSAEDVGLIEARTHYRTVIRGSAGLYITHPRAIARAYNLVAA